MKPEKGGRKNRFIRIVFRILIIVIAFLFTLTVVINIPSVQTFVVKKITNAIREKTGAELSIGSVKIAFPKTVDLRDIYIQDQHADTLLYLHSLKIDVDLLNLLQNKISVSFLGLENMVSRVHRTNPDTTFNYQFILDAFSKQTVDTTTSGKTWLVEVKNISLKNVSFSYIDDLADLDLKVELTDLNANIKDVDFNKNLFNVDNLLLKNTSVRLITKQNADSGNAALAKTNQLAVAENDFNAKAQSSIFPDVNISVNHFLLEEINFQFDDFNFPVSEGFDSRHMLFSKINTRMNNVSVSGAGYKTEIDNMSFTERCGIVLKNLSVDAQLTNEHAGLKDLKFESAKSNLSGDVLFSYHSFNDFTDQLGNCETKLEFNNSTVNTEELLLFAPALSSDSVVRKFRNTNISFAAKAHGKIDDLDLENLEVSGLQKTRLKTNAKLTGLPDFSRLGFKANIDLFSTVLPDVHHFINLDSIAGLNLPHAVELKGTVSGKMDSIFTSMQLSSNLGAIAINAFYRNRNNDKDTISLIFSAKNILAGVLLGDTLLGKIDFSGTANVSRATDSLFYGTANLKIEDASYNHYIYKDILINGRLNGNNYSADVSGDDPNICFVLAADADFSEAKKKYSVSLNLSRLNLQALNLAQKNIVLSTNLKAQMNYAGLGNSDGSLQLTNTNFISDNKNIPVKLFELKASSGSQGIEAKLNSDLMDVDLSGNIKAENFVHTFQTAFQKYFGKEISNDLKAGDHLSFRVNIHVPKDIINLVNPKFEALEISKLQGDYTSDNNELSVELQAPKVNYSGIFFDTLNVVANGKNDKLSLGIDVNKISYGNLRLDQLRISEKTNHGNILSEISIRDTSGEMKYLIANEIEIGKNFYKIRFLPEGLILDGNVWKTDDGNQLISQKNNVDNHSTGLSAQQFVFTNGNESFGIVSDSGKQKLEFRNFALQNILNMAEFQNDKTPGEERKKFVRGNVDGEIIFPSPGNPKAINVNLAIRQLSILDSVAGNLTLRIKTSEDKMDLDLLLADEENRIQVNGIVDQLAESPALDIQASIDINNLHRLEHFALGTLSEMSGKVNGKISLKGNTQKPEVKGELGFEETKFKINSLNFQARINHEKISIQNKGIHFDNFVIEDVHEKKLTINGDILTSNFSKFEFDLNLSSKKFQAINSTVADNKIFYGNLSLATDVHLKGDIKSPKIEADFKLDSATNLTYAFPGSELKLVSSEGIVQFINSSQAVDSMLRAQESNYLKDSIISRMNNVNLNAHVEIDPGAKFTIDIDPKSGDYLTVSGRAKLDIVSDGSGKQSINGIYEVNSGYYELSFYDLVKKKFNIMPGSTVAWSGRPMDADLNITAEYVVRTSSVALVANETSSMSDEEKKIFNKRLPYEVKLNIRGFLAKPEISFNITLPNQYLNDNPMVAAKLAHLNTEDMTPQLNKQVFALLVTGGFMAENPMTTNGSSSSNIASTAARNSVNGILSNQLNDISSKYISGVDVNFGLNSYEDYSNSSGDTRTEMDIQVSKKLFNERITVEAENSFGLNSTKKQSQSTPSTQGYGQFAVIYRLTESGEYKLRAYYQNAYDPFDGDIAYSGIALIFEKELDSLKRKHKDAKPGENKK